MRPTVPAPVAEVLRRMLDKRPANRPGTAAEVAARLEAALAQLVSAEGPLTVERYMTAEFASAQAEIGAFLADCLFRPMCRTSTGPVATETAMTRPFRVSSARARLSRAVVAAAALAAVVVGGWAAWIQFNPAHFFP